MKLIYCAGAYRAEHAYQIQLNINKAWNLGVEVAKLGLYPIVPHTNSLHMEGTQSAQFFIDGTLELMRRCDAVLVIPGYEKSFGTKGEIAEAEHLGIPVFYNLEDLKKWKFNVA